MGEFHDKNFLKEKTKIEIEDIIKETQEKIKIEFELKIREIMEQKIKSELEKHIKIIIKQKNKKSSEEKNKKEFEDKNKKEFEDINKKEFEDKNKIESEDKNEKEFKDINKKEFEDKNKIESEDINKKEFEHKNKIKIKVKDKLDEANKNINNEIQDDKNKENSDNNIIDNNITFKKQKNKENFNDTKTKAKNKIKEEKNKENSEETKINNNNNKDDIKNKNLEEKKKIMKELQKGLKEIINQQNELENKDEFKENPKHNLEDNSTKLKSEKNKKELEEKNKNTINYLKMPNEKDNYNKNEINSNKSNNDKNILNENNKSNQIKNEDTPIIKYKNIIFNKILELRKNKSSTENNKLNNEENKQKAQNNKTKKKHNKITKSIELSDIIKNDNLFLSDKNNNPNLIQKFEYAKAIDRIIQDEIKENKDNNLITPDEAVYYIQNNIIRFYGYFGSELIYRKINTFIEKIPSNEKLREITFKILTSGLAFHKVYKIIIENKELKSFIDEDESIFNKYFEELKKEISKQFEISKDNIFYFSPNIDNYEQNLIIYNNNNIIEGLENFLKLENLDVQINLLLNNIILSPCIFEENFCKTEKSWSSKKSKRGGKEYIPPWGWYGISLKVSEKYEKSMTWLGKKNMDGEWAVAYHAIGNGTIFNRILDILDGNLKNEEIKLYKNDKNIENNKNKYPLCGEGLYCSPNIQDVEKFADKKNLGYFNIKFQFALMTRVNPSRIRNPGVYPVCWILSGNNEEIRPYRLLFKICSS